MSATLTGIPVSGGVGLAPALIITKEALQPETVSIAPAQADTEMAKFADACALAHRQLSDLYERTKADLGHEAEIVAAQIEMLQDPEIMSDVRAMIQNQLRSAQYAVQAEFDTQIDILTASSDEYIRQRSADLADVKMRLMHNLQGRPLGLHITEEAVIVCDVLAPSETAGIDPRFVKGIICQGGGPASHTAIIAKNMGIPTIMGCKDAMRTLASGSMVYVDGSRGEAFAADSAQIAALRANIEKNNAIKSELARLHSMPAITTDGAAVNLYANIGSLQEVSQALDGGAMGVGLFRTEFIYMESKTLPGEDAQFNIYKNTLTGLPGKKVIFRTFDIGGDKEVACMEIPQEDNPFLGWRAVRICLERTDLFLTQLRAMLRASIHGDMHIMIPMIASLSELRAVREIFEDAKAQLRAEGIPFNEQTPLGIMIEIPSAAICADSLIMEADFFSIGTNDLVQYTLAVDRGNDRVAKYYDFYDPAVLRLVKMTIDAAHHADKTTGMCGEAAGDVQATLLLLGLGLDSFSASPGVLSKIKKVIISTDIAFAQAVAKKAMTFVTAKQVREYLQETLESIGLGYLLTV